MKRTKIEFYGEYLSIEAIAKKLEVSKNTVKRYYESTNDIYETEKICKKIVEKKKKSLIEYNGEYLTLNAIAKKEKCKDTKTLKRYYEEEKDIYKAVERYKKLYIEYNGEYLTLNAIAKKEEMKNDTLKRYYDKTEDENGNKDIYKAVQFCKEMKEKRAKIKEEKQKEREKEKKPKEVIKTTDGRTLKQISEEEELSITSLYRNYRRYHNADKAVFITRINKRKENSQKKEKDKTKSKKITEEVLRLEDGTSLYEYCLENSLNYKVIEQKVVKQKKKPEQVIEEYKKQGQPYNGNGKYKEYGILLKHFLIENKLEMNNIKRYMKKDGMNLEDAIEKCVIRSNASKSNLNINWTEELYYLLKDEEVQEEYEIYKKDVYVNEKEEQCIEKSRKEVEKIKRQMILFEISEVIKSNAFSIEEENEILKTYNITTDEIDTIFLDLYSRYENGVLMGEEQPEYKRRKEINEITKKWYYLGQQDRKNVIKKNKITRKEAEKIQDISREILSYKRRIIAINNKNIEKENYK